MSRRALVIIALGATAIATAAGAYLKSRVGGPGSATPSGGDRQSAGAAVEGFSSDIAIPVEGTPVIRETLVISVTAAGQAAAARETKLLAQIQTAARVLRMAVRENQSVVGGELLLVLDSADAYLALTEARAARLQAQATYRDITLGDLQNADSAAGAERTRIARARSGLDQAEARLARAELELARTRVTAPFAGRIANLLVVEGQSVRAGDELLSVVDLDPLRVEVHVLETEVGLLAAGRRAQVVFAALPGETSAGRVTTINPIVEDATRTARVTVTVRNPGGRVLPGMYARVSLEARTFANRILVPRTAILERDRRTMLFVYEGDQTGGLAKWRYVTTGLQNDSLVEIVENPETEMVRPGEMVLTDGHYTLIHDARVRLVPNVRDAGGRPQ